MQLLREASKPGVSPDVCARDLFDAIPSVMKVIRGHMRRHRSGLSVPQFRTLYFISITEGGSLSAAADFIGLSLPAMSRLVDGLVEKRLVLRRTCDTDRRHVRLALTEEGLGTLREAQGLAIDQISEELGRLTPEARAGISQAMHALKGLFGPETGLDCVNDPAEAAEAKS